MALSTDFYNTLSTEHEIILKKLRFIEYLPYILLGSCCSLSLAVVYDVRTSIKTLRQRKPKHRLTGTT